MRKLKKEGEKEKKNKKINGKERFGEKGKAVPPECQKWWRDSSGSACFERRVPISGGHRSAFRSGSVAFSFSGFLRSAATPSENGSRAACRLNRWRTRRVDVNGLATG